MVVVDKISVTDKQASKLCSDVRIEKNGIEIEFFQNNFYSLSFNSVTALTIPTIQHKENNFLFSLSIKIVWSNY